MEEDKVTQLVQELREAINDVVIESPLVVEKVKKLRAAGYDPWFSLVDAIGCEKIEDPTILGVVKPRVKDGEIVPGTISPEDLTFLKTLHIKADGDTR